MKEIQYTGSHKIGYTVTEEYTYYAKRYNRRLTIPKGFKSDGATGVPDIDTDGWLIHDWICDVGLWDDGTKIDNWTASTVFGDILWRDGFKIYSVLWWIGTFAFGGGKARENGLMRVQ